ncbi:LuxR family two component transcriptional regulator [Ulvibacter sp. MAR_2010_11]|uniref:response regulator transcription factor n=1 Tax=Ulvibacter sp. MAR_2010_11 TaxID=1250229 RepID=UPI000C2BCE11|nr:response regulator transcription factor [Ulvibacter sp. MAR_2010_11]PKA82730.1 LuxR family two component transcriptional regulator [Ulvibacter sp. MAR_2010_11]
MTKNTTILVADDHPILLKGLMDELDTAGYTLLEGAPNGALALNSILELRPDIAILDIEMPLLSGFEVIQKANEKNVATKFIILTSHKERGYVVRAKKLNISGYILKDEPFSELNNCIRALLKDETYFSITFDTIFKTEVTPELKKIKFLSPSERTIVRMVAQEKTSKEISQLLSISLRTVQKHRANIISKLGLPASGDALTIWTTENKELILSL